MYQQFTATTIDIDPATKKIHVNFTNEIDEETVDSHTFYVGKHNDGARIPIEFIVDSAHIYATIIPELEPNVKYVLCATTGIKNAMGESLAHQLTKEFQIISTVRSTVDITAPYDYQDITGTIEIKWNETIEDGSRTCDSYFVQIADNHLFEKSEIETYIRRPSQPAQITGLKTSGQKYIRMRAQKDTNDYGPWSNPITIVYTAVNAAGEPIDDDGDSVLEEPVFIRRMEVLTTPEQGETPDSFIIEFDDEIDPASVEDSIILLQQRI